MKNIADVSPTRLMELAIKAGYENPDPLKPNVIPEAQHQIYLKFANLVGAALREVNGNAIDLMLTYIDDLSIEAGDSFYTIDFTTPGATIDTMALYRSEKRKSMYYVFTALIAKELRE
jgi:hypothetical protein